MCFIFWEKFFISQTVCLNYVKIFYICNLWGWSIRSFTKPMLSLSKMFRILMPLYGSLSLKPFPTAFSSFLLREKWNFITCSFGYFNNYERNFVTEIVFKKRHRKVSRTLKNWYHFQQKRWLNHQSQASEDIYKLILNAATLIKTICSQIAKLLLIIKPTITAY